MQGDHAIVNENEHDLENKLSIQNEIESIWVNRYENSDVQIALIKNVSDLCIKKQWYRQSLECDVIMGQLYVFKGNSEKALEIGEPAISRLREYRENCPEDGSIFELRAHNFMGTAHMMRGDYSKCLDFWQKGLQLSGQIAEDPIVINILHNMAELYRGYLTDHERALDFYLRALQLSQKFDLPIQWMLRAGTALCLAMANRTDEAMQQLEDIEANQTLATSTLPFTILVLYYQFRAHAHLECQDFHRAITHSKLGLKLLSQGADTYKQLNFMIILARSYSELDMPTKALHYCNTFMTIEQTAQHTGLLIFIYKVMAKSFGSLGQFKEQAEYSTRCLEVTEREFHIKMERQAGLAAAITREHLLQKDLEIHQLRNVELKEKSEMLEASANELTKALNKLILTQQQLVESEKLAALGRVISGVAHEVNTPLGVACSALSYLEHILFQGSPQDDKNTDVGEAFLLLDTSIGKVIKIVSRFKEITTERKQHPLEFFNVNELTEMCISVIRGLHKDLINSRDQGVEIINHVPIALVINSFPQVWQQIITELLSNAIIHNIDVNHKLTIEVWFEVEPVLNAEANYSMGLFVQDNGVGVPVDFEPLIFEPFSMVQRKRERMGLGLHGVHNVVMDILQGEITYTRLNSMSTRFTVYSK